MAVAREIEGAKCDRRVIEARGVEADPPIATPEAALPQQAVLGEGGVHSCESLHRGLHFSVGRSLGRESLSRELVVDLPRSVQGGLRGQGDERRTQAFESGGGQPGSRHQPVAARYRGIRPLENQPALGPVDLDAEAMNGRLQTPVLEYPDRPAGQNLARRFSRRSVEAPSAGRSRCRRSPTEVLVQLPGQSLLALPDSHRADGFEAVAAFERFFENVVDRDES